MPKLLTTPIKDTDNTENDGRIISAKPQFGHSYSISNNILAEIEAVFVATYKQDRNVSENAINEFLKYNTVLNVWPFWREHAFRISAEARLPRPSIGLKKPNQ